MAVPSWMNQRSGGGENFGGGGTFTPTLPPPAPSPYTPPPGTYTPPPQYQSLPPPNYAANNAQIDVQSGRLQSDLALGQQQYGMQAGYLNQDMANQLAGIGLDRSNLSIQQQALARQMGLLPQYNTLQQRSFGIDRAELDDQLQNVWWRKGIDIRDLISKEASQGALTTQGTRDRRWDIEQQAALHANTIWRQMLQQDVSKEKYGLDTGEQQAKLADQQKVLENMGKRLGLSENEVKIRTEQALAQLGLSTTVSTTDILRAIEDLNAGRYNVLAPVATQVAQGLGSGSYQQ